MPRYHSGSQVQNDGWNVRVLAKAAGGRGDIIDS